MRRSGKRHVVNQIEGEGKRAWREEVEGKQDLGDSGTGS